jgi:hypothetical protein
LAGFLGILLVVGAYSIISPTRESEIVVQDGPVEIQEPDIVVQDDRVEPPDPHFETQDELYGRIYNGWKWFHVYCFRCHGVDAAGSDIAPNLRESIKAIPYPEFHNLVREGRPARGMQSWKALLDNKQITDIFYYVQARSDRVLTPGRPDEVGKGGGEWIPPLEWTESIKEIDVNPAPADGTAMK